MDSTKKLIIGGFLTCLIVTFQLTPVMFGEFFVLLTILSTLPLYIISRIDPKIGFISFISSFFFSDVNKCT